jgi:hypothetical protein
VIALIESFWKRGKYLISSGVSGRIQEIVRDAVEIFSHNP